MTKPKLIISSYDDIGNPYYQGGGAKVIHQIAIRLHQKYQITVISGYCHGLEKSTSIDGVNYQRIGFTPQFFPPLGQIFFQFLLPFKAVFLKYDLWLESFTPPFSTAFLPLFTRKPIIGWVHFLSGRHMTAKYHLPFSLIEKVGLKLYHQFITLTNTSKAEILAINPQAQIKVIPNGINPQLPSTLEKKNQICYLGRIEIKPKGIDLLIEAFNHIGESSNFHLVIAGSGIPSEEKKLVQLIDNSPFRNRILLMGRLDEAGVNLLLNESKLTVIPSRYETFSMVALESMAHSVPVICFDIEGLKWMPSNCVCKAEPYSSPQLGREILDLMTNAAYRQYLGSNGKKLANQYSWSVIAKKYHSYFDSLL